MGKLASNWSIATDGGSPSGVLDRLITQYLAGVGSVLAAFGGGDD